MDVTQDIPTVTAINAISGVVDSKNNDAKSSTKLYKGVSRK